jgi:PBP1b-binding outer membrane lipoprotein LpoB
MKTSARMRSVSQSVQPEDPPSAKKQKTAPAKPKERTKRQPSIVEEEVESDVEEPIVEKPKNKVAAKPVVEKKAKENKPVAPRLTVRKVSNNYFHQN